MKILGIHGNFGKSDHDAAAVLIIDNQIIAAAEEERFIRYKHAVGLMPDRAIQFCLNKGKVSMKDINIIAFPRATWSDFPLRLGSYLQYNFGYVPEIEYLDHHTAHASSCYHISGFSSSLIITYDLSGDGIACGIFRGRGGKIEVVDKIPFPNSIGLFAAFITQYLGFRSNHDEYKVMGLSSYGVPDIDLSKIMQIKDGNLEFNTEFLHPEALKRHPVFCTSQLPLFKNEKYLFLPSKRLKSEPITDDHKNLAASAQKVIEEAVFSLIKKYKTDEDEYLCIGGGVAENSVVNGKIAESGLFKDIYITPACGDAGSALGAALYTANKKGYHFSKVIQNKWGTSYADEDIKKSLDNYNIKYHLSQNVVEETSELLAKQNIVAWFQDRMEFGSRALGSRSLLCDPSNPEMKEKMNRIKKREQFRPFAPSVLSEHQSSLFKTNQYSPFMSFTLQTTNIGQQKLISATHIDKTARLQSVAKDGSIYRKLIESFYSKTNVPAVLNTSLNSGWEPIVENPEQALAFFYSSETNVLVLDNYIIKK